MAEKLRLGDLLVKEGIISDLQLQQALTEQKETGQKLGQVLLSRGLVTEESMLNFLAKQLNLPMIDLKKYEVNFELAKQLPESYARRFHALLLQEQQGGYLVGMVDPLDITAIDELKRVLNKPLYLALLHEEDLLYMLDQVYRRTEEISGFAEELKEEMVGEGAPIAELTVEPGHVDAPVIKLLRSLFEDAVQTNASDIHIEPDETILRIRQRIDGVLHEHDIPEKAIAPAISLRLKLMAGLNISERRLPQDGRFNVKVRGRVIDVRLSTMPTQYGESIVMRLLDQSAHLLDLDQIGMPPSLLTNMRRLFHMPNGIILVTGPTGSGKSTTLYGALSELNVESKKLITAEDPVEYRLPRVNQIQANEKLGFDFPTILRSMLRQDPDIIMVGEIRDKATADIAMRAALTGHLVLSTLHTNDSASTAVRLLDMDVDGYLIAATLRCVLAQRLVRRICPSCKSEYTLTEQEKAWLLGVSGPELAGKQFYIGKGCSNCSKTGYKGRIGVFELLELAGPMLDALRKDDPGSFAKYASESLKGKLLMDQAIALAVDGVTTPSEVVRIIGEI